MKSAIFRGDTRLDGNDHSGLKRRRIVLGDVRRFSDIQSQPVTTARRETRYGSNYRKRQLINTLVARMRDFRNFNSRGYPLKSMPGNLMDGFLRLNLLRRRFSYDGRACEIRPITAYGTACVYPDHLSSADRPIFRSLCSQNIVTLPRCHQHPYVICTCLHAIVTKSPRNIPFRVTLLCSGECVLICFTQNSTSSSKVEDFNL